MKNERNMYTKLFSQTRTLILLTYTIKINKLEILQAGAEKQQKKTAEKLFFFSVSSFRVFSAVFIDFFPLFSHSL
jgi:hypothetical protein